MTTAKEIAAVDKAAAHENAKAVADAEKAEKAAGKPHVFRADRGEGIPTPPIKTATDHK